MLNVLSLQCQFTNTPHMELDCGTNVLTPGALLDVPIRFFPRELCPYHEKVTFILNSCITREVSLLGHGVKMKVSVKRCCLNDRIVFSLYLLEIKKGHAENGRGTLWFLTRYPVHLTISMFSLGSDVFLKCSVIYVEHCVDLILLLYIYFFSQLEVEDPRQRTLNLGCLNAGCKLKKKVKLVNRSSIDLSFELLLNTQLDQKVKMCIWACTCIYTHKETITDLLPLILQDLSLNQTGELNLRAGDGSCFVEILFSPQQRLPAFTAKLLAQCAGVFYPLLTLQGSCPVVLSFVQFHSDLDFTDWFRAKSDFKCRRFLKGIFCR